MEDNHSQDAQLSRDSDSTPGEVLRAAREKAGLSLREVADKLHLLPDQVIALETSNYKRFNAEIFCKGYIKAYGQLLGLPVDPLIERYMALRAKEPVDQTVVTGTQSGFGFGESLERKPLLLKMNVMPIFSLIGLIVLCVIVFLVWQANGDTEAGNTSNLSVIELKTEIDAFPDSATQVKESSQPIAQANNEALDASRVSGQNPVLEPSNISAATLAESSIESVSNDEDAGFKENFFEDDSPNSDLEGVLNFTFSKDCWVQVVDANSKVIFSDLKKVDSTLALTGKPPFSILLGYAPGVTLTYNGQLVPIEVNRNNNSARVIVSRSL